MDQDPVPAEVDANKAVETGADLPAALPRMSAAVVAALEETSGPAIAGHEGGGARRDSQAEFLAAAALLAGMQRPASVSVGGPPSSESPQGDQDGADAAAKPKREKKPRSRPAYYGAKDLDGTFFSSPLAAGNGEDGTVKFDDLPPEQRMKIFFNREYNGFHEIKNVPHQRPSVMRNKEVDLCRLYDIVMRKGGAKTVTGGNAWRDVYNLLNGVTNASTNVSYYSRLAYEKHLIGFEAFMKSHGASRTQPLVHACEAEWEKLKKTLTPEEFEARYASRKRKRGWRDWGTDGDGSGSASATRRAKKDKSATAVAAAAAAAAANAEGGASLALDGATDTTGEAGGEESGSVKAERKARKSAKAAAAAAAADADGELTRDPNTGLPTKKPRKNSKKAGTVLAAAAAAAAATLTGGSSGGQNSGAGVVTHSLVHGGNTVRGVLGIGERSSAATESTVHDFDYAMGGSLPVTISPEEEQSLRQELMQRIYASHHQQQQQQQQQQQMQQQLQLHMQSRSNPIYPFRSSLTQQQQQLHQHQIFHHNQQQLQQQQQQQQQPPPGAHQPGYALNMYSAGFAPHMRHPGNIDQPPSAIQGDSVSQSHSQQQQQQQQQKPGTSESALTPPIAPPPPPISTMLQYPTSLSSLIQSAYLIDPQFSRTTSFASGYPALYEQAPPNAPPGGSGPDGLLPIGGSSSSSSGSSSVANISSGATLGAVPAAAITGSAAGLGHGSFLPLTSQRGTQYLYSNASSPYIPSSDTDSSGHSSHSRLMHNMMMGMERPISSTGSSPSLTRRNPPIFASTTEFLETTRGSGVGAFIAPAATELAAATETVSASTLLDIHAPLGGALEGAQDMLHDDDLRHEDDDRHSHHHRHHHHSQHHGGSDSSNSGQSQSMLGENGTLSATTTRTATTTSGSTPVAEGSEEIVLEEAVMQDENGSPNRGAPAPAGKPNAELSGAAADPAKASGGGNSSNDFQVYFSVLPPMVLPQTLILAPPPSPEKSEPPNLTEACEYSMQLIKKCYKELAGEMGALNRKLRTFAATAPAVPEQSVAATESTALATVSKADTSDDDGNDCRSSGRSSSASSGLTDIVEEEEMLHGAGMDAGANDAKPPASSLVEEEESEEVIDQGMVL